jgi:hypothetical protein
MSKVAISGEYDGYRLVSLPEQKDPQCTHMGLLLGSRVLGFVGIHSNGQIDVHLAEKSKNHLFPLEPRELVEAIVTDREPPAVQPGTQPFHARRFR